MGRAHATQWLPVPLLAHVIPGLSQGIAPVSSSARTRARIVASSIALLAADPDRPRPPPVVSRRPRWSPRGRRVAIGETPEGSGLPGRRDGRPYWITECGVASRRVTLIFSRSIRGGTLGAISFFQ